MIRLFSVPRIPFNTREIPWSGDSISIEDINACARRSGFSVFSVYKYNYHTNRLDKSMMFPERGTCILFIVEVDALPGWIHAFDSQYDTMKTIIMNGRAESSSDAAELDNGYARYVEMISGIGGALDDEMVGGEVILVVDTGTPPVIVVVEKNGRRFRIVAEQIHRDRL